MAEKISFFGIEVMNVDFREASEMTERALEGDALTVISTPNTEIVMMARKDEEMKRVLNDSDLVVPDGIGLIYGSKIRGCPMKERVTGFDLSIRMLELANEKGYGVYLLGGKPGVGERAAENLKRKYPGLRISGVHHGYFKGAQDGISDSEEDRKILAQIEAGGTDILFVGMGYPKQERWIHGNREKIRAKVAIGNGGVTDILAGEAKRAPAVFQRLGLEWFYRLLKDPKRIGRQMNLPLFLLRVFVDRSSVKRVDKR